MVIEDGVLKRVNDEDISKDGTFNFPDGITSIEARAFSDCQSLTSVTIPDGVTSIGAYAFFNCARLISITIPYGVTSIRYNAFSYCKSLVSVIIPGSVTSIEYRAFYSCPNLVSVAIMNGVISIKKEAFSGCSSLVRITIPDSITLIEPRALYCATYDNLKYIIIETTDENELNRIKNLLPEVLRARAFPVENWNKYQAIKERACYRLRNSPFLNPLFREMQLSIIQASNNLFCLPSELFAYMNRFLILDVLDKIEPSYSDVTDEALTKYESMCQSKCDEHLNKLQTAADNKVFLLASHINGQYKPKSEMPSKTSIFSDDKLSYSKKIVNISEDENMSPCEKLKAITQETQNQINKLAKSGSGEELKQLILTVTGQMPEDDKLKAILEKARKAKKANQSIQISNLRTKLQDLADKLVSEKEGLASLSAPVSG